MRTNIIVLMLLYFLVNVSFALAVNPVKDLTITQFPSNIIAGESYNLSYSFEAQRDITAFLSFYAVRGKVFDGNEINISQAYFDNNLMYCSSIFEINTYTFVCPSGGAEVSISKGEHKITALLTPNILIEPESMNISLGIFTEDYKDYQEPTEIVVAPSSRNSLPFKCVPGECVNGVRVTKCTNPVNSLVREYNLSCVGEVSLSPVEEYEDITPKGNLSVPPAQDKPITPEEVQKQINETMADLESENRTYSDAVVYGISVALGLIILAIIVYAHQMYKAKRRVDIESDGDGIIEDFEKRKR